MALNPPSPFRVRPLPVIGASAAATAVFVVVIAVTARLTADGVVVVAAAEDAGPVSLVDAGPVNDAGPDALDGGVPVDVDAGALVTVEPGEDAGPEPDAGPPGVELPPYDPAVVAAAAAVVVERCARDALRWDPSLGGPFTLRVLLPAGTSGGADAGDNRVDDDSPRLGVSGLPSPILEVCLSRQAPQMARAPGTLDLAAAQAVQARGVLRADGTIEIADPVIVSVPPATTAPDGGRPR